jgi:two-component system chemotaxis response regulator CheY
MSRLLTKSRVLIFEPDRQERQNIQKTLISLGIKSVFQSATIEEALRMIEEIRPDMILSTAAYTAGDDCALLAATREMEEYARKIPFIILSRKAECELVSRAIELGAKGYVLKPFDPSALKKHCLRILHGEGVC